MKRKCWPEGGGRLPRSELNVLMASSGLSTFQRSTSSYLVALVGQVGQGDLVSQHLL